MLTRPPTSSNAAGATPPGPSGGPDDLSGHRHRQVIGYLGLALPILLVLFVRLRPPAPEDQWLGSSLSAYYWTGAVALFAGLLAALSLFLLTYRGYDNAYHTYDRAAAIVAGVAAAAVALFPTRPPAGVNAPWWREWVGITHWVAAATLFSMFAIFSLWLFTRPSQTGPESSGGRARNGIYVLCGVGIVASMIWTVIARQAGRSIFWSESLALGFFASSWLTKGRALRSIRNTVGAAATKAAG